MRRFIRSNLVKIAVLAWFVAWLVVVMPGHQRGIVTLPDAEQTGNQAASCCQPKPSCCGPKATGDCPDTPGDRPADPAKHCAICFLKAHLTDPPPVTLYTPFLGELDELAFHLETAIADQQTAPDQLRGRAPPA